MGRFYEIPKRQHPDFALPNVRPKGKVAVDWENPISRGLADCFIFNGNTAGAVSGLVKAFNGGARLKPTGGAQFDGTDTDYLNLGVVNRFNGAATFTILLKGVSRSASSTDRLLGRGASLTDIHLSWWSDSNIYFDINNESTERLSTSLGSSGTFDLCFVYDGTNQKIYSNGAQIATQATSSAGIASNATSLILGAHGTTSPPDPFGGDMDAAFFWSRGLSAQEVQLMYRDAFQVLRPGVPLQYFVPSASGFTITATQSEAGDVNALDVVVPANLTTTQTEAAETNSLSVNALETRSLTVAQTEASEANSLAIAVPVAAAASQTEASEVNSAGVTIPVNLESAQTEAIEANTVSLQVIASASNLTLAQTEASEVNAASVEAPINLVASQSEASEVNAGTVVSPRNLTASQTETSEDNSLFVNANEARSLTAAQGELSESNSLSIDGLAQAVGAQDEASETNSATLQGLIRIAGSQAEGSEVNSLTARVIASVLAAQTEAAESNALSLIEDSVAATVTTPAGRILTSAVSNRGLASQARSRTITVQAP